ncbi:0ef69fec-2fc4-44f8-be79-e7e7f2f6ccaa [Sclerotinia trifoliorum]|uniref:0ef69fec-2fc4-44f8-be79-e7e7f2f6ccaa n=1 Tax=Sclerotinia trifoliorum TaxID=28548 RepID=A0A8H2ZKN6_9HELO|nr:0ef69fec-2fc4-44f8-be79-e7e7f2f6ccaa [Sclerotinia trifoliorum]
MSNIILILGGGPNVGLNVARVFSTKGSYKTVSVSRTPKGELTKATDLSIQADFNDPNSIKTIFDEVKQKFGVPNVVVYNAYSYTPCANPLAIPVEQFNKDLNVVVTSAYAAAYEAVEGFKTLPEGITKTFIYNGNITNRRPMPGMLAIGMGKSAVAHLIHAASELYKKDGYRFYWADERTPEGGMIGYEINGEAHGDFFYELATSEKPLPWDATFVAGKGYVDFHGYFCWKA